MHTTIRLTVVTICALATLVTVGFATGLQYYFAQTLAREAAGEIYAGTSAAVASEMQNIARLNANVIDLLAANRGLEDATLSDEHLHTLAKLLQKNPLYYSVYVGHGDGRLFELINLEYSPKAREELGAQTDERWLQVNVGHNGKHDESGSTRSYRYLDVDLLVKRRYSEPTDYDTASRPWYTNAIKTDKAQVTAPYQFAQLGVMGRTISQRIPDSDAVVAIDMTMATITQLLNNSPASQQGQVVLFSADGQVLGASERTLKPDSNDAAGNTALSSLSSTATPGKQTLLQLARSPKQHSKLVETSIEDTPHFTYTALVSENDLPLFMSIVTPRSVVLAPFLDKVKFSIAISVGILLLLLPLSWLFANPIVKPIKQLARENRKVQRREYSQVSKVDTSVLELAQLSDSMLEMASAIEAHEIAQRDLMDAIIKVIAEAIDDKSSYTGGHCERVPELAMMLARQASHSTLPCFADFRLEGEDEWREYQVAAWLHDCGKITMPEHIVDKGSKLETIYNRIHEIRMRFEVLWRDRALEYWQQRVRSPELEKELAAALRASQLQLQQDYAFVAGCNVGAEYLDQAEQERLKTIGKATWQRHFSDRIGLSPLEELRVPEKPENLPVAEQLLADKPEHLQSREQGVNYPSELKIKMEIPQHLANLGELYNLSVTRGTLTKEDRFRINEHMISTIKMLERLPFPDELSNVPRYASTHHETLKGTGYPRRLSADDLSIPERILAIADIFEALTASDRPYKKAKTVSEAIAIMHNMVIDKHIDKDCFELFLTESVYLQYAHTFLAAEQIDNVDMNLYITGQTVPAN